MIILTLFLIIILLCISLYLLRAYTYTELYTSQESNNKKKTKDKCVSITPPDPTNMDCGKGLYMQAIINVPGNNTQIKCCRIK
jgi:hypothetical protein